jgi:predicted porin
MRKLLLASVATLGFAGAANAAMLNEINPAATPPDAGGIGGTTTPAPITAWNAPKANPDPGKTIVHFDGLFAIDAGVGGGSGYTGTAGSPNAAAKADHYNMGGVFRLYLGFDGKTPNGLLYGGMSEMRTDFVGPNNAPSGFSVSGAVGNGSANTTATVWYTRRAYIYMGTPMLGLLRFGQGDGVTALFTDPSITTGEAYDTGQFNGDVCDIIPGNDCVAWGFEDVGNEYAPMKITYLSPSFAGFVFAADFAPNSTNLNPGTSNNAASGAFQAQSSSTLASDWARPRNTFEVGTRYTGSFGPVAVEGSIAFQKSAVVNNATLPPSANAGVVKFKGVDVIDAGVGVTFMGASVFGHLNTGTMNGTMTPQAEIPGRSRDGTAWVEGAMYTNGPWTVGTSFYTFQSEGSASVSATIPGGFPGAGGSVTLGNRVERGWDTGVTYNLAPGCNLYLDYAEGWRHQVGVNFNDPAGTPLAGNQTYIGAFLASATFFW